jgi:hypothetical protein
MLMLAMVSVLLIMSPGRTKGRSGLTLCGLIEATPRSEDEHVKKN